MTAERPASPARRDVRIDTLRGAALAVMTLVHLPGITRHLFFGVLGYVGFAETFVFIAGLVAGMLAVPARDARGPAELRRRSFRRAAAIWATHLALLAFFLGVAHFARTHGARNALEGADVFVERPIAASAAGALLLYAPPYADILSMYCLFFLALPFVVAAFDAGGWRARAVLAASALLWAAANLGVTDALLQPAARVLPVRFGFDPLAWQLLFVAGAWFGVRRARARPIPLPESRPVLAAVACVGAASFLTFHRWIPDVGGALDWLEEHGGRERFEPVRVVAFANAAWGAAWIGTVRPRRLTYEPLAALGRHPLPVFAAQSAIAYCVMPWKPPHEAVQIAIAAGALLVLWGLARLLDARQAARHPIHLPNQGSETS